LHVRHSVRCNIKSAPSAVCVIWKKTGASREFPLQWDVVQSGQGLGASGKARSTYILDFDIRRSSLVNLTRSSQFIAVVTKGKLLKYRYKYKGNLRTHQKSRTVLISNHFVCENSLKHRNKQNYIRF
jgi:hypothetical protein